MPYTVWGGFDKFRKDVVDLDTAVTQRGRASRGFLREQLDKLSSAGLALPHVAGDFLSYGSFARRTKIQPLNDIDLLYILNGGNTRERAFISFVNTYHLDITNPSAALFPFSQDGEVSSIQVLNRLRDVLAKVPQYSKAEIHRRRQAVTLNLTSYPWVFDVVPAVPISDGAGGRGHFLIPDGTDDWIRTDPRTDQTSITELNRQHSNELLPVMRLLKYWNTRPGKPVLPSYYFESVTIKIFSGAPKIESYPKAIHYFFSNRLQFQVPCTDPKGLGPNLDEGVDLVTKTSVVAAMLDSAAHASLALESEVKGNIGDAYFWWQKVFGSAFPKYEGS